MPSHGHAKKDRADSSDFLLWNADAVGEGSSASGGENPGAQNSCEEYKPTSKVRRLEGVRPALRNGNESSTSLSSGASRCSNLGGGWQPQGDSADSCSSTSGTSGTNMEDFFDNNTTDAVAGWQTDDSIPRNLKARSSQARRSSGGQARGEPEEALAQTESELPDSKCTY
mmetsp:Transcript_18069/g.36528  ORF Transcript_18069/g.36528 Transcript_18069/m.36528 type:complete len:170 (-) Transcript_18069:99-608(-)